MRGAGKAWHKTCFTCTLCNKRVDSSNLCERDGDIFCKGIRNTKNNVLINYIFISLSHDLHRSVFNFLACYGKNFGPKGFGFGLSAGSLQINTTETATAN